PRAWRWSARHSLAMRHADDAQPLEERGQLYAADYHARVRIVDYQPLGVDPIVAAVQRIGSNNLGAAARAPSPNSRSNEFCSLTLCRSCSAEMTAPPGVLVGTGTRGKSPHEYAGASSSLPGSGRRSRTKNCRLSESTSPAAAARANACTVAFSNPQSVRNFSVAAAFAAALAAAIWSSFWSLIVYSCRRRSC